MASTMVNIGVFPKAIKMQQFSQGICENESKIASTPKQYSSLRIFNFLNCVSGWTLLKSDTTAQQIWALKFKKRKFRAVQFWGLLNVKQ